MKVYYHIIRKSDGSDGFDSNQLGGLTTKLNQDYNKYGIFFSNSGFEFINDNALYNLNADGTGNIFYRNRHSDAVDIYLVYSYTGSLAGCAQSISSTAFFCVNGSASDIISHEMGHCLGLYHTHRGAPYGTDQEVDNSTCEELINGGNCTTCGDYICDTKASPNLYQNVNANCQYTGPFTQNGLTFNPDVNNIMSYTQQTGKL